MRPGGGSVPLTAETFLLVPEESVESREAPIAPGYVLLEPHLLLIAQPGMGVDLLFQDPELVPHHHDLVEEGVQRKLLFLGAGLPGSEDQRSTRPAAPQR